MTIWLRIRWAVVTFIGCVYCLLAPRSFYRRK